MVLLLIRSVGIYCVSWDLLPIDDESFREVPVYPHFLPRGTLTLIILRKENHLLICIAIRLFGFKIVFGFALVQIFMSLSIA